MLQTGTGSTTLQTGTGSTTLQTGTGSTLIQSGTDSSTIQAGVEKEAGPINILFIVDGSRSMLEPLERGVQKMDSAKQVLQNALSRIPNDVKLGLRVFGQGANTAQPSMFGGGFGGLNIFSECQNSALWVPIATSNRRSILEKVRQIKPYGMTPLAYAIEQAATQDFRGLEGRKVIILITDGADTCNGNPCEMIARLPLYGIKLKVDVVGLALGREPEARRQLDCIAKRSGGNYYDAKSSAELINSISTSVSKAIEGRVIIKPSSNPAPGGTGGGAPINIETPIDMVPIEGTHN
jgi:Ca-activated chloride channel family protein